MKFKAIEQDLPGPGETVTVLDETGDVFFHVDPNRVGEMLDALITTKQGKEWLSYLGMEAIRNLTR